MRDKLLKAWADTDPQRTKSDLKSEFSASMTRTSDGVDKNKGIGLSPGQIAYLKTIENTDFWELIGQPDPEKQKQAEQNRRIAILDAFTGTRSQKLYYYDQSTARHIIDTVNQTYGELADNLYDGLLFQTRLRPYLDAMRLRVDEKGEYSLDYSGVSALFNEIHKKNPGKAFTDLGELLAKSNDGKNPALAQLAEQHTQYMAEAAENGTLTQYAETLGKKNMDTLGHRIGTDDNDNLGGNASANYLTGGAGDDKLYGGKGHDTLVGGAGNDYMEGGDYEADTYHFARGHGKDTVYDWSRGAAEADTLTFHGAKAKDAVFGREGSDLTIRAYGNADDQVTVQSYYSRPGQNYYNLQFDDITYKAADIRERTLETEGLPTATTATDKAGEVAPATTVPAENNQSGTGGQTVMEPVSGTAVNAGTTGVTNAAGTATTDRTPSGANSQTATASANSAAADAGATGVNKTAAATADNAPSGADSQTTTAPAASEATVTETENANKAAESTATAATPDIDAQAAAQAHRLITAMAASDGRSASTEALAAPPLQQPPLAAAATDSTAKPLLP